MYRILFIETVIYIRYYSFDFFFFNFSDAFDEVFMFQTLTDIQAGKTCTIPVYNYKTNSR